MRRIHGEPTRSHLAVLAAAVRMAGFSAVVAEWAVKSFSVHSAGRQVGGMAFVVAVVSRGGPAVVQHPDVGKEGEHDDELQLHSS